MTVTLRWNRLTIAAKGDAEFKSAVEKGMPELVKHAHGVLEVDIGQCQGIGEEGFKSIGLRLVEHAGSRKVLVRASAEMRPFFEGSGLAELVELHLVERMDAQTRIGDDDEDAEVSELAPESDEEKPRGRDETHPPSGDAMATRAPVSVTGGALVDEEDGTRYDIGDELVVGREAPSGAVFQIPTISKKHFRIFRQGPGFFIEDLRSTNGTYLNGDPLTQPHPLGQGDEIVVAITLKHPEGAKRFKFAAD